jgi:hypothetical protein
MNLKQLKELFLKYNCQRFLFKILAANDNSKNQIYAGGDFSAVSILPCKSIHQERTGELPHSNRTNKEIFKADVDFSWINENGEVYPAPNVQMILYPQYPEVRMSGFLKGCKSPPSELIRAREEGRILLLGVSRIGKIFGYITNGASELAKEVREQKHVERKGVFYELSLYEKDASTKEILISNLTQIYLKEWIRGKRLKSDGTEIPYNASNAGGYTLEAELGILPQGFSEPDYLGWEIKQHKVSSFDNINVGVITLMTPEPDAGFYKEKGAEAFVRRYGHKDQSGRKDRINFGGTHYIERRNSTTGLTLILEGYDAESNKIYSSSGGICLTDGRNILAKWSYVGIIEHWKRKHSKAAYVPSISKVVSQNRMYWFGPIVRLGEGTDILLLLKAMNLGSVYYDPGIKLENIKASPRLKRRSQFRIYSRNVAQLYQTMEIVDLKQA